MSRHPHSSRSHLPSIHIPTTPSGLHHAPSPQPSPAPFSVLTEPPSSSTESLPPSPSIPVTETTAHPPPDIFLFPATPSDTPPLDHQFGSSEFEHAGTSTQTHVHAQAQAQAQTQVRIQGSSRLAKDAPSSSGRKHRVTMGPRADCTKCKMGVKGHWMHFD
ncbi:hypothetical protein BS17DRAFT_791973 [Gyrodon lividus]|nr:hypothetical protein BS17DRAFT_791973 [Gyrodon lividus]